MRSFPKIYNSLVVIKILGWTEKTFFPRTSKEGGGGHFENSHLLPTPLK